jgi:hypothetical protein
MQRPIKSRNLDIFSGITKTINNSHDNYSECIFDNQRNPFFRVPILCTAGCVEISHKAYNQNS